MSGGFILIIVLIKLIAPTIDETPANHNDKMVNVLVKWNELINLKTASSWFYRLIFTKLCTYI